MLKIAVFLLDDALWSLQCFLRSQQQVLLFLRQYVPAGPDNMLMGKHEFFFLHGNQLFRIMGNRAFKSAEFFIIPKEKLLRFNNYYPLQ